MYKLSSLYQQNNQSLAGSYQRLATGKKFQSPSDDLVGFIRSANYKTQERDYANIKTNLTTWSGGLEVASTASGDAYKEISRLNDLVNLSNQTTDHSLQDAYNSEFQQHVTTLQNIVNTTVFQGKALLKPATDGSEVISFNLNPDASATMSIDMRITKGVGTYYATTADIITPLQAVDISSAGTRDIAGATTAVATATSWGQGVMSKASGYVNSMQSQANVLDTIVQNIKSVDSSISDINDAEEMTAYTSADIRSQSITAMIAQANISRRSILALFGMH